MYSTDARMPQKRRAFLNPDLSCLLIFVLDSDSFFDARCDTRKGFITIHLIENQMQPVVHKRFIKLVSSLKIFFIRMMSVSVYGDSYHIARAGFLVDAPTGIARRGLYLYRPQTARHLLQFEMRILVGSFHGLPVKRFSFG